MLKKCIFLAIALLVVGLTVVQAQTKQQQQELEQIAKRSMKGLSSQDRQRVIQIMTDVYVAQGMSRQQAATLAEMAADSMFSSDIGEMTAEEKMQFQEQDQRLQYFEGADERIRQAQEQERREAEQRRLYPGETKGWPTTAMFRGYYDKLASLKQPAGTNASYDRNGIYITIYLSGGNANTVIQDMERQINSATKQSMTRTDNGRYLPVHTGNRQYSISIENRDGVIVLSLSESAG